MKSRSQTEDHSHWSGSESTQASGHGWHFFFFHAALGKAYEHHVGKALHSAAYCSYTKTSLLTASVNCNAKDGKLSV